MRLIEHNDSRVSEGQQAACFIGGLKLQIKDKIAFTILKNLNEAKNMNF